LKAILGNSSCSKMPWLRHNWYRVLAHALALAPLVALAIDYLRDDLTANPIRFLTLRTGIVGLLLLVAALACTPINTLFGWRQAITIRRALGLYAFTYIALHLLIYAVFDGGLDFELIWRDIQERRAMLVGLVAFLMLVPLAITSTNGWQRRLGKRWRMLHWLIYLAAPFSVLHFFWLDRDIKDAPIRYAAVVAALLMLRLRPVRRAIVQLRYRLVRSWAGAAEPPQTLQSPPAVDAEDQARPAE
jgi:sulfoxide reductase heme-binding subunit YedZ